MQNFIILNKLLKENILLKLHAFFWGLRTVNAKWISAYWNTFFRANTIEITGLALKTSIR